MRIVFALCLIIILNACNMATYKVSKINGVSFVASKDSISGKHITPLVNISANYAAIMPYGFIRGNDYPEIIYNTKRQWFGESKQGARQYIEQLHQRNISVMMKPHLWIRGEFTGQMIMTSIENWSKLKKSYKTFIMEFAELAEDTNTDILCIGTELEQFIIHEPTYWQDLIEDIRKVYKGKLTYAANWDEFTRTPFWNQLDFIGIDAYFPVSDSQTPTVEECLDGWRDYKKEIREISKIHEKPILFTEFGYRSVDFSGKEPWKSDRYGAPANLIAQNNTTEALFHTFWREKWFAGGFIWKWFHDYEKSGGKNNNQFTPQNKPVERIIKKYYINR